MLYLKETPNWRAAAAFVLILAGVILAVTGKTATERSAETPEFAESGEGPCEVGR